MTTTIQELKRSCSTCNSEETYVYKRLSRPQWRRHPVTGGWLCHKCYCKLVSEPKRMFFQDKKITLDEPARCGVCNWCRNVVGQFDARTLGLITRTHMHHEEYHDDDPLKDAIEICVPCHRTTGEVITEED